MIAGHFLVAFRNPFRNKPRNRLSGQDCPEHIGHHADPHALVRTLFVRPAKRRLTDSLIAPSHLGHSIAIGIPRPPPSNSDTNRIIHPHLP